MKHSPSIRTRYSVLRDHPAGTESVASFPSESVSIQPMPKWLRERLLESGRRWQQEQKERAASVHR